MVMTLRDHADLEAEGATSPHQVETRRLQAAIRLAIDKVAEQDQDGFRWTTRGVVGFNLVEQVCKQIVTPMNIAYGVHTNSGGDQGSARDPLRNRASESRKQGH